MTATIRERRARIDNALDHARAACPVPVGWIEESLRDHREILREWALGDADKMNALMLSAFLREFGKAPEVEAHA